MSEAFSSSRSYLNAELARLDLILQRAVWRWRQANPPGVQGNDEFRGLYVSEGEIDAILSGIHPGSERVLEHASTHDVEQSFSRSVEYARETIARRLEATAATGTLPRLVQLVHQFGLGSFDQDSLLIALAPEVELRYERLYAYLQDDVTRKRPSVSLMLNLLCDAPEHRLDKRTRFYGDAPLLRHGLIALVDDPAVPHPPLLARYVKVTPRVVEVLLADGDDGGLDDRLSSLCRRTVPETDLEELVLAEATRDPLRRLAAYPPDGDRATVVLLSGDRGTSKLQGAQAVCAAWQRPLLVFDLDRLIAQADLSSTREERHFEAMARLAMREAFLSRTAIYWQGDVLSTPSVQARSVELSLYRETLHQAMQEYPVVSFVPLTLDANQPDGTLLSASRLVRIDFCRPSYVLRHALWDQALASYAHSLNGAIADIAGRFRLTEQQIAEAALDAHHRAAQRPPGAQEITCEDLFASARARTADQMRGQAKKVEARRDWQDLILPDDQIAQLHELCDQMKYRHTVLGEWGFDRKLSMGKGLNALFAGPSGTGKTMAAEVIARDLGLDLFKIDLSTVMSKYVGETEKNLERIFAAAHNSNAILFFDEADALFGKRSEVRDAHDRYANVEISYLLQRMEEYEGLVILTSNLSQNMDDAFVRRMHFTVEFPYPEEEDRRRIWEIAFPAQAPLSPDIDLDLLSERYRLTGGNIRNVALTAAFLAARDGGIIDMNHLLWATRREYQKMGRLADEREFVSE